MLNKKLKVFLSLFAAITVMGTMCFATEATPTAAETENTVVVSEEAQETQEAPVVVSEDASEENSTEEGTSTEGENAGTTEPTTGAEPQNGDIYRAGDDVTIEGAVNGNVFVMAKNLTVTGQIGGDLFVMANNVNIDGAQIYGNVFAFADTITLNGLIYDLYGACNKLEVLYNGTAYRDLKVICSDATIDGVIGGNVKISASSSLKIDTDCIIYQNLDYSATSEIEIPEGAVQGETNYSKLATPTVQTPGVMTYVMTFIYALVYTLIIWLAMTFIAPKFTKKVQTAGKCRPVASILFGLAGVICTPIVALILVFTLVGIPVACALLVLWGLILTATFAFATVALANILAEKVPFFTKAKQVLAVIVVSLVLWLLSIIPVVGGIISAIICLYGFGVFILAILNKVEKKEKLEKADKKETKKAKKEAKSDKSE